MTLSAEQLQRADALYDAVRGAIGAEAITPATVIKVVVAAMEGAEKLAGVAGPQKKELVLHVIARLVAEIPDREAQDAVRVAVALLGPATIDALAAAGRGEFAINVGKRCGCGPSSSCCVVC